MKVGHRMTRYRQLPVWQDGEQAGISAKVRDGGRDLVVFLHGLGCADEAFDGAFEPSRFEHMYLSTFDFPGHGRSASVPVTGDALEQLADIVVRLVADIPHDSVTMVCHSLGGAVGLLAAERLDNLAAFISIEGNLIG